MAVLVPPIKCQGIKTKLVPLIMRTVERDTEGLWIEPFLGSGVVALNVAPKRALLADANPHVIAFYKAIRDGRIDALATRTFLEHEGYLLSQRGKDYYYEVRERFNASHDPLDFLFLNRSCFNGVIRFNKKGGFNVPFGHKPRRFAPAYVTKIVNQVDRFRKVAVASDWVFVRQSFDCTIAQAGPRDFIYCDPPYVGRHVDYYDSWSQDQEVLLHDSLLSSGARFLLSTWHSNQHRHNEFVRRLWKPYHIRLQPHFYHVGARETNRKPMMEAVVTNYTPSVRRVERSSDVRSRQRELPLTT